MTKTINPDRHQENLAGIHGRAAQEWARSISVEPTPPIEPTDTERRLATQLLQAASAMRTIRDEILEALAAPDLAGLEPRQKLEGLRRLAGELGFDFVATIHGIGGGVDLDGDPDPFSQVGR